MLKLLLDEHVSPEITAGLLRRHPSLVVHSMAAWEDGNYLGQDDAVCLQEALVQGLTLVTYDGRTIPPLLKRWAEEGRPHPGVIFVDEKTISPADIGSMVKALSVLVKEARTWNWAGTIVFLRR